MKKLIAYLIYILLLSGSTFAQSEFKVIGYAQSRDLLNINDADWSRITHLGIGFINADATGTIVTGPYSGQGQFGLSDADIKGIVKKAHKHNVKVFISLAGGGFWGDPIMKKRYHDLVSPEKRGPFIKNLSDYLTENELDGIDIDIEGDAICKDLGGFMCDMSVACKKNNWELSAAWGGRSAWADSVTNEAIACLDFISIMSYDSTGSWAPDEPGQHASYFKAVDDINYWHEDRGVEYNRLVLGLPFYGKNFAGAIPGSGVLYSEIVLKKENAFRDNDGMIWYNGKPTIEKKTQLAINKKLGGVMIWEILGDADGDLSLLSSIQKTIIKNAIYERIEGFELKDKRFSTTGETPLESIDELTIFNDEGSLIKTYIKKKLKIKEGAFDIKAKLPETYHVVLVIDGKKRLLVQ